MLPFQPAPVFFAPDADAGADATGDAGNGGTPAPDATSDADAGLGDAGKRALAEERKARTAAEREAKAAKAELDKLRDASQTEQEKALEAARSEARAEVLSTANERLIRAEVRGAAASTTVDADAVVSLLDLSQFEVSDDGTVDRKAISSAIEELLKEKPYLAANGKKPADLKQGARGASSQLDPNQWMRDMARR